nr:MAG TPA: hypothetical protein [Caudoviricetes sp.]
MQCLHEWWIVKETYTFLFSSVSKRLAYAK